MTNESGIPKRTFVIDKPAMVPSFRKKPNPLTEEQALDVVKKHNPELGSKIIIEKQEIGDSAFIVQDGEMLLDAIKLFRDDPEISCNQLRVVAGIDYPKVVDDEGVASGDFIQVAYVMFSLTHKHQFTVKVNLNREKPVVDSVTSLFRVANFQERECYDMFGIVFQGHPNFKRILLPSDWTGYPLKKDYQPPEQYNGMKVPL